MVQKNLITSFVFIISAAFGLVFSVSLPHAQAAIADWQRGGTIQPFTTTDFASDAMKKSMDGLKATGANTVTLIIPYYQANRQSTDMRPGWNTPTDDALATAIDYAHSIGFKVMLKPHLETDYIEWRGNIEPAAADRPAWYESYATMLEHYGRIGQAHGVEDYCIGTEILKMASPDYNPDNTAQWQKMIARVRTVFKGKLTYSANWYGELDRIGFWPQLDYIGISAYYDLYHAQNNSVDELKKSWDNWRSGVIEPIQKQYNMPIVFTELGYRSIDQAYRNPWDWSKDGTYNETDQANAYQALFEYWNQYPWMKGVDLWRWEINPPAANSGDKDYTPQNKKAEAVMKSFWNVSYVPPSNSTTTPPTQIPDPGTVQGTSWSATAGVNPQNPATGAVVSITPVIKNQSSVNVSNSIVDVEIYNSSGASVFQKYFQSQNFSAGQSRSYNVNWTAGTNGNYKIAVGIFNGDWTTNYYWKGDVAVMGVGSGSANPPATSTTTTQTNPPAAPADLQIWWPGDGVSVQGLQPFKAMLTNSDVANYNMYWQVDGDRLNDMGNSTQDYPHKEALVDLSGWNWKTSGQYGINFVTKDKSGNLIQQKAVNITVTH